MAVADRVRDVILRDGSTMRLRPPLAADADRLLAFFGRLSQESLYLRFHGIPSLDRKQMASFLDPDWEERGSLVGTLGEGADEQIAALASYVRLRDPTAAEVAFAVADELQGRGLGTRLLEQLAEAAAAVAIETFVAEVLPGNRPMLKVFADAGFAASRALEGGAIEVRLAIEPTADYRERVAMRDHVAVVASLRPFFEPRSVAVFGASPRRGTIGGELFRNVVAGDFAGAAFPINRTGEPVAGVQGHRSIDEIPEPVDLAVVCVPAEAVLDAAESALRHGTRALTVVSAGFAETGPEGARRQEQLLAAVRAHGARLIGPNCLGLAVAGPRLNATFAPRAFPPGRIGFSSQSGALGLALLEAAEARGLGLSAFVSIGNKADVSSNDLLEYWEEDAETDLVLLYLESFGNPRKFARVAGRVARQKPVLAMKSGRTTSGAKAAGSHTAALAGSDAAVEALFGQAGVIRAETLDELLDVAVLLSSQPLLRGPRVGVLTNAGGLGILCADACESARLELPALGGDTRAALARLLPAEASVGNPVDMLGSATAATYEAVLPHVLADDGLDAVIALFVPPVVAGADDVAEAVIRASESASAEKPVLAAIVSHEGIPAPLLRSRLVAAFLYPESAARALGRAAQRTRWLRRPLGTVVRPDGIDREAASRVVEAALRAPGDGWLEPSAARQLLLAYGIPLVEERLAGSADEAVTAAGVLGYPVVVKTAAPGAHKTELGGIALDLAGEAEVRASVERIGPPVLLQRMVEGGVELLVGALQDPVFGPLVAFGPGGVLAELIGAAQFRLAPLTDVDADELVHAGKAGMLVQGFRGAPPADATALADVLARVSRLVEDLPEVAELDLNPVLGLASGCVAVDARVRVDRVERPASHKTW
jgi:acetyl coenzyme A synthetase (ADP forming)-like protein